MLAQTTEMPPAIYSVATTRSCGEGSFIIQAPHLALIAKVVGDSVQIEAKLVSRVPTDPGPESIKAFVAVDGVPVVLYLAPRETISLAFPHLTRETHRVRYGTYRGNELFQNMCETI
jgi:hypothetical protein